MFEQAVLSNGPASKRVWTTFAGVTGQALLVTFAVMIPMIWPEAMPSHQTLLRVFTPSAPLPPPPADPKASPTVTHAVIRQFSSGVLTLPHSIPPTPQIFVDPPETVGGGGVPGGVPGGIDNGVMGGLPDILRSTLPVFAPPRPVETAHPTASHVDAVIPRYKEGGNVHLGKLVHRVEPLYPRMAALARVSGVVELVGVVGIDGRIRELKLKSGHPMLAPAAIEAVRQWIYEPTTLNGDKVEIIAPITVTFRLN